jgi:hypothetical protein
LLGVLRNDGKPVDVADRLLMLLGLSASSELEQVLSLDLEQTTLNRGGATQAP